MAINPVVHLIDDDDALRSAMLRLLRAAGYEVCCYASAGEFLLKEPAAEVPGCILLDVQMPEVSGLQLQDALIERKNSLPVIFITGHGDIPMSVSALKRGAVDFLTKPVKKNDLFSAISNALARDASQRLALEELRTLSSRYDALTPRERQIYACLVKGMLNKQIAYELSISERTVKAHRAKIVWKMEARSFAELIHIADRLKIQKQA